MAGEGWGKTDSVLIFTGGVRVVMSGVFLLRSSRIDGPVVLFGIPFSPNMLIQEIYNSQKLDK